MKKKNNTHLLKPDTIYSISINPKYINIEGKKYDFELDYVSIGMGTDGGCIKTLATSDNNKVYICKYGSTSQKNVYKPIKVLNQIFYNYNHLLKDGNVYEIVLYPESYITINNKKYEYELNTYNLHLDLIGDVIKIEIDKNGICYALANREITNFKGLTFGDTEKFPLPREPITIIKPLKKMSSLNQIRLETINGKNKSSDIKAIKDIIFKINVNINGNINKVVEKILNSNVYKNGKLVDEFIKLNSNMLDSSINNNMVINPFNKPINVNDILSYVRKQGILEQPIGMYELYVYKYINLFMFKVFPNPVSNHLLSTKHFVGTPPVWENYDIIGILRDLENDYKKIKKIYKLVGFLKDIRLEQQNTVLYRILPLEEIKLGLVSQSYLSSKHIDPDHEDYGKLYLYKDGEKVSKEESEKHIVEFYKDEIID